MNEIDWKRKLTSRKFWAAVCSLVANLIIVFGGTEQETVQVTALIMAGAAVVAYIIGEGLTDAAGAKPNVAFITPAYEPEEDEQENAEESN